MKKLFLCMGLGLMYSFSHAQLIDENFNSGLPGSWTQWSEDGIGWEADSDLGVDESGCAVADYSLASDAANAWLQTPWLDLTGLDDPEMIFSAAVVQNNFVSPMVSLWYDIGEGWVYLANWGSEWGMEVDNFIDISHDLAPPLDFENLVWNTDLVYDLSALSGASDIRFAFGSDFVNGGWVLVDDVTLTGSNIVDDASIFESQDLGGLKIYPNPASDVLYIEKEDQELDRLEIYNLLGEKVMDMPLKDMSTLVQLSLEGIQAGMYMIVFYVEEEKRYTNLVSIH